MKNEDWPKMIRYLNLRGLSQTDIANYCGCKQPYISKLMNKRILMPDYPTARALQDLYDFVLNEVKE